MQLEIVSPQVPARPGPDFLYVLQEQLTLRAIAAGGQRFLDVGCGMGRVLAHAESATSRAHGVDTDAERVQASRRACPNAEVRLADAGYLPFASRSMDAVTLFSTLCVVGDPVKAIGEISRVLRPGGRA